MNEEDKAKAKAVVNKTAGDLADKAVEAAQSATGWKKLVLALGAIIAGAIAYFTAGCTATVSQAADGSWQYTGIIVLPVEKGGK